MVLTDILYEQVNRAVYFLVPLLYSSLGQGGKVLQFVNSLRSCNNGYTYMGSNCVFSFLPTIN